MADAWGSVSSGQWGGQSAQGWQPSAPTGVAASWGPPQGGYAPSAGYGGGGAPPSQQYPVSGLGGWAAPTGAAAAASWGGFQAAAPPAPMQSRAQAQPQVAAAPIPEPAPAQVGGVQCAYCGCVKYDCLAMCPISGFYFCNGKGDCRGAHCVDYLRQTDRNQLVMPQTSRLAQVPLKCFLCAKEDIFALGFLQCGQQLYIVCRNPCQFAPTFSQRGAKPGTFQPLIRDQQIRPDILPEPAPEEYMRIPAGKAREICDAIKNIGGQQEPEPEIPPCQSSYSTPAEFCRIMRKYVELEGVTEEREQKPKSWAVRAHWEQYRGNMIASFSSPTAVFKLLRVGARVTVDGVQARVIQRKPSMEVTVEFDKGVSPPARPGEVQIRVIYDETSLSRQLKGLERFEGVSEKGKVREEVHPAIRNAFLGILNDDVNVIQERIDLIQPNRDRAPNFPRLNDSQVGAGRAALRSHFAMIVGPPGSGKTTLIAALAYSFFMQNYRTLIVAQTNVAVDNITLKVVTTGLTPLRVFGQTVEGINDEVARYSSRYGRDRQAELDAIRRAGIVLTTTGSVGGGRFDAQFKKVIIEESSQAVDPDLLQAVVRGCDQLILVGDHNQLGPFLMSQVAKKNGYGTPLMLRLAQMGLPLGFLKVQYRMHSAIAGFASKEFYRGLLATGVPVEARTWPRKTLSWPNPNAPLLFWDLTKSKEDVAEGGRSYLNSFEALGVALLMREFYQADVQPESIAVITPYLGQVRYLRESLSHLAKVSKDYVDRLEIDTVDAFQGREKDFVVFSCVRANPELQIGFLADKRRMNVALTRARFGLAVVGNSQCFARNKFWADFIEYCDGLQCFVTGDLGRWRRGEFKRAGEEALAEDEDGRNEGDV